MSLIDVAWMATSGQFSELCTLSHAFRYIANDPISSQPPQKTYLALSDGVGGWSQSGHDPSLFSESLTYHSHLSVLRNPSIKPMAVLEKGYEGVSADEGVPCGSATFCGVSLSGSGSGGLEGVK